jgi:hypothetical protein
MLFKHAVLLMVTYLSPLIRSMFVDALICTKIVCCASTKIVHLAVIYRAPCCNLASTKIVHLAVIYEVHV